MSCEIAKTCPEIPYEDCYRVEQLDGCDFTNEEDYSNGVDTSFNYYEDDAREKYWVYRSVEEGDQVVDKPLESYLFDLKEEYKPKDGSDKWACYEKFLERVVGRFASEALQRDSLFRGTYGGFEAVLTEDEYQRLSGMEEVAQAVHVEHFVSFD